MIKDILDIIKIILGIIGVFIIGYIGIFGAGLIIGYTWIFILFFNIKVLIIGNLIITIVFIIVISPIGYFIEKEKEFKKRNKYD